MHWKSTELLQKSFTILKQIFFFFYLNKHRQFLYFHNKINIPIKLTAHPTACHSDGERANISVIYTDMSNINPVWKSKVFSSMQLNSGLFFSQLDFLQKFLYDSCAFSWDDFPERLLTSTMLRTNFLLDWRSKGTELSTLHKEVFLSE